MKIKFWQEEWNNISLLEIAKSLNYPLNQVADYRIYEEYYNRLEKNGYKFQEGWLEAKWKTSFLIRSFIDDYGNIEDIKNPRVLYVGVGLGIIEAHLIEKGYDITLQECQEASFNYLRNKNLSAKMIISQNLMDIGGDSFDIVYSITSTYAMDDDVYLDFLKSMKRIVKHSGFILIWEHLATLDSVVKDGIKQFIGYHQPKGILWGWLRPIRDHISLAKEAGLRMEEALLFDRNQNIVKKTNKTGTICHVFNRCPIGMMIYKKD